jgi:MFS family permease
MSVAPARSQASYFAIASAIAGVTGAIGTAAGGFLAQASSTGGLTGLFALSAVLRLVALLPLILVREPRSISLIQLVREAKIVLRPLLNLCGKNESLVRLTPQAVLLQAVGLANRLK